MAHSHRLSSIIPHHCMGGATSKYGMFTPLLKEKAVYTRESQRRLGQLYILLQVAARAILLALLGLLLFLCLLAFIQNKRFPWLPLLHSLDMVTFFAGSLLLATLLLALLNHHAWRLTLLICRTLARHFCRAGRRPPATDALFRWLSSWQQTVLQADTATCLLQLRAQQVQHPPTRWPKGKAPLGLFQRANLRLAP